MMRRMRALLRDRQGAALPIMAAGLLPVLAGIGAAIDIGRIVVVRAQMQAGVDAGALAGARAFGLEEDRDEQVAAYFQANMPDGYAGADPIEPSPIFEKVRGVSRVRVAAETDLPMVFMRLFGMATTTISVESTAEMQPKPLEVMVVLDNTGSMKTTLGSGTRMDALKTAMHDFIEILHQGQDRRADLAMGITTYTVTTNVGHILRDAGVTIGERDGFTNIGTYVGGNENTAALGWSGCVENDQTVRDISAAATVMEANAYDIDRYLPGERDARPGIRPYHYMPLTTTQSRKAPGENTSKSGAWATSARKPDHYWAAHQNNNTSDGRRNNLYRLDAGGNASLAEILANKPAYRQYFHDFYIGLNYDRSSDSDDVIVRADNGGYFEPGSVADYKVVYSRIPRLNVTTDWDKPNAHYGSPLRSGTNLRMPTPNWQCPSPALELAYDQPRSTYDDYIKYDNYPLMPASGTLHHIGMLWGYRLLTRDDVFKRENPTPSERPLRALVFMTDGDTQASSDNSWYGAYGALREKRITNATDTGTFKVQVMNRFAKVCENAKRDGIAVYIVSLLPAPGDTQSVFRTCAGANYLETSTQSEIQNAFRQIAVDLVDLHLTQ
ncbi:pilus assembly protein [Croceibacterium sp. TMG7-5b_MA50]|uniref:pilus assembly protein n=1 Tax=Croceibacterium sp. TMG7-5b_MA50 TaxID=3121290 RepID=UPI0032218FE5